MKLKIKKAILVRSMWEFGSEWKEHKIQRLHYLLNKAGQLQV